MSRKSDKGSSPVQIDIGARAEAKLEVKARVPSSSVGRFVDAVTDLFRPTSEARGLKADLIRLQREEVAIKIAHLARERSIVEGKVLIPPPLKILIPLFERASQEEGSDAFIIDLWANLLISACSADSIPPRFISLIGEMNSRQAKLFLDVIEKPEGVGTLDDSLFQLESNVMEETISDLLKSEKITADKIFDGLMPLFDWRGVALDDIIIDDGKNFYSIPNSDNRYGSSEIDFDLRVLTSLGLFEHIDVRRRPENGKIELLNVRYFLLTELGRKFYEAVGGRKP